MEPHDTRLRRPSLCATDSSVKAAAKSRIAAASARADVALPEEGLVDVIDMEVVMPPRARTHQRVDVVEDAEAVDETFTVLK